MVARKWYISNYWLARERSTFCVVLEHGISVLMFEPPLIIYRTDFVPVEVLSSGPQVGRCQR